MLFTLTATGGVRYKGAGCWRTVTAKQKAAARKTRAPQGAENGRNIIVGKKRGLVILAEFPDKKFRSSNNPEKYNNILNTPGYTTNEGFKGSVADYFKDQSGGLFDLQFDIAGPYTTKHNARYYGKNDDDGFDEYAHEMIYEMCLAADSDVNYSDYDWDGDGEVDEVFVLYAGKGEVDGGGATTIWPHMWTMDEAGLQINLDGVKINTYACANELTSSGTINGIGTFCHEFSHCMGFPDFYDLYYTGLFGMGDLDLMAGGNYRGNSFLPVGYTAYEKMVCGWKEPIVLSNKDVVVDSLKPISEHGDTYIIYNDASPNEFYMIENRQRTGWDKDYPAQGLMITHVDYDAEVWLNNIPNSILTYQEAIEEGYTCGNDHERMVLFHADNDDDSAYWSVAGYYRKNTKSTDLFPYQRNDSLTATSIPAATLFYKNSQGKKFMQGSILDIKQNSDGTIGFRYRAGTSNTADGIQTIGYGRETTAGHCQPSGLYDLQGRKVSTPASSSVKKGLYIQDGHLVMKSR